MRTSQTIDVLGKTQLFSGLDHEVLEPLAEKFVERTYRKRDMVFRVGDPAHDLFVVAKGLVKVYVTSEEGEEMVLVTLGPPEVFGELALVDGGARSASAQAVEETALLALDRDTFLELRRGHPAIAESVDRSLGAVLRRLTEQTADLVFLDLHGRVAKLLLGMADRVDAEKNGEISLDVHLTQRDLAGMVGGSRQSVNQILGTFERTGYLKFDGRKILLKRPDLLRRRAGI